jgi:hypothetical protein
LIATVQSFSSYAVLQIVVGSSLQKNALIGCHEEDVFLLTSAVVWENLLSGYWFFRLFNVGLFF